jgi:hypothetical protein
MTDTEKRPNPPMRLATGMIVLAATILFVIGVIALLATAV